MKKITIITSVLNSRNTIRQCIGSVLSQTYSPIEYIVIDGGSTDGTFEIIKEYSGRIGLVISEPDNGVYDALNKGLNIASGDIVGILHSDDFFNNENVLKDVMEYFDIANFDAIYGDLAYISNKNPDRIFRYWKAGSYDYRKFLNGWMPPHPATFIKKQIYDKFGNYNPDMGSASDYELLLRFMFVNRIKVGYIPKTLIKMRTGGISNKSLSNRLLANKMDKYAWKFNNISPHFWTLFMKPARKICQYFMKPSF